MWVVAFHLLVIIEYIAKINAHTQCKGTTGHPVEWWFIYRIPGGTNYVYYDPTMTTTTTPAAKFEAQPTDLSNLVIHINHKSLLILQRKKSMMQIYLQHY